MHQLSSALSSSRSLEWMLPTFPCCPVYLWNVLEDKSSREKEWDTPDKKMLPNLVLNTAQGTICKRTSSGTSSPDCDILCGLAFGLCSTIRQVLQQIRELFSVRKVWSLMIGTDFFRHKISFCHVFPYLCVRAYKCVCEYMCRCSVNLMLGFRGKIYVDLDTYRETGEPK